MTNSKPRYDYVGSAINAAHHAYPKKVTATRAILRKLVREAVRATLVADGWTDTGFADKIAKGLVP